MEADAGTREGDADREARGEPSGLARAFERLFDLDEEERTHLDELTAEVEVVEPRRKLTVEGTPCSRMFIIKTGWMIEAKQLRDGGRQILAFRLPGDLVGIECLAYKNALHSTAALTRCTVAPLSAGRFEVIQRQFPRLATALFLMTLRESAILHEWEVNLGRRVAIPRVAHLLQELDYRVRRRGLAQAGGVPFPLTQEEIADCTGLTIGYVNRVLQAMRERGLIRLADRTLEIVDGDALGKMAGFRPDYIEHWGKGRSHLTSGA